MGETATALGEIETTLGETLMTMDGAVECDDLSGRVRGTDSYLVSNLTSLGWLKKGLKGKRFPSIIIEAFSEHLAKGFVGTPKLSVLQ